MDLQVKQSCHRYLRWNHILLLNDFSQQHYWHSTKYQQSRQKLMSDFCFWKYQASTRDAAAWRFIVSRADSFPSFPRFPSCLTTFSAPTLCRRSHRRLCPQIVLLRQSFAYGPKWALCWSELPRAVGSDQEACLTPTTRQVFLVSFSSFLGTLNGPRGGNRSTWTTWQ